MSADHPTPPDDAKARRIAQTLSDRMKQALLWLPEDGSPKAWPQWLDRGAPTRAALKALSRRICINWERDGISLTKFTGTAVRRAILQESAPMTDPTTAAKRRLQAATAALAIAQDNKRRAELADDAAAGALARAAAERDSAVRAVEVAAAATVAP